MTDRARALAEEIRSSGLGWHGANELHEVLRSLPGIAEAVADLYRRFGGELEDNTNLNPSCPEAVHEAAARIGATAKELDSVIGGGVTGRHGGSSGTPAPEPRPAAPPEPEPRPAAPPEPEPGEKRTTAAPWVPGPAPLPGVPRPRTRAGVPDWGAMAEPGEPSRIHPRTMRRRARRAHRRAQWKRWTSR